MIDQHKINIEIGKRLRFARLRAELSQNALGAAIGVQLQQIQKYEKGQNSISAPRLVVACMVLGVAYDDILPKLERGK